MHMAHAGWRMRGYHGTTKGSWDHHAHSQYFTHPISSLAAPTVLVVLTDRGVILNVRVADEAVLVVGGVSSQNRVIPSLRPAEDFHVMPCMNYFTNSLHATVFKVKLHQAHFHSRGTARGAGGAL
jgi:hypothetical protein